MMMCSWKSLPACTKCMMERILPLQKEHLGLLSARCRMHK